MMHSFFKDIHRIAKALECRRRNLVFGIQVSEQTSPVTTTPHMQRCPKGKVLVMLTLTSSQKATLTVSFLDKKGNPAPVDGAPTWGVDNPNVAALVPSVDGLSAEVSAIGPLGTALVSVQADADLGEGMTHIAGTLEVTVVSGAASTVEIVAGEPTEQE